MNILFFCLTFLALFIFILMIPPPQSRLLTSQHPVVMNSTVSYMVGRKRTLPFVLNLLLGIFIECTMVLVHFSIDSSFPGWTVVTQKTLHTWLSLLSFPLKVSCCSIFKDWKISAVHNIQEMSAVYKVSKQEQPNCKLYKIFSISDGERLWVIHSLSASILTQIARMSICILGGFSFYLHYFLENEVTSFSGSPC